MSDTSIEKREQKAKRFPIEIVEYSSVWPRLYEEEAQFLRERFGPVIVRIEHYGSTAVPGLAAKPCIDILVEISSFDVAEREIVPVLDALGYGHDWYKDHIVFFKGYFTDEAVKCHIHMAPAGHRLWEGLLFSGYLRSHPEVAREYEELKYRLANQHCFDREAYTDAKTAFVREITEKASRETG
ncbi:MAG: GrpB family protein [Armatimonadetes bacterium]|nr:GrpB family protein [Armatimonadota bacterium]